MSRRTLPDPLRYTIGIKLLLAMLVFSLTACSVSSASSSAQPGTATSATAAQATIRLGYFPNLTHTQALFGIATGSFAASLGNTVKLEPTVFNAGPSEIEALLAGQIDLAYIGPSPTVNAYIKTKGESVRVIAGAVSGGASLIVRSDSSITRPAELAGKKIASPQFGNTQDVALRTFIKQAGLNTVEQGGTVQVVPTDNANILQLFDNRQIDGAWVTEPYASILLIEKKGRLLVDERTLWPEGKFVTTQLIASTKFLNQKPELVAAFLKAHLAVTRDIQQDPGAAKQAINRQLKALTGKALSSQVLDASFSNIQVQLDPVKSSLLQSANNAYEQGFLGKEKPNLDNLYDLRILNRLLTEQGQPELK